MKKKNKLSTVWISIMCFAIVVAVLVACTSILGHIMNGVKPIDNNALVVSEKYSFTNMGDPEYFDDGKRAVYEGDTRIEFSCSSAYYGDGTLSTVIEDDSFTIWLKNIETSTGSRTDAYAFIGEEQAIEDGYLCIVYDVDVENWFGNVQSLGLRPCYRDASGNICQSDGTLYRYYYNGVFKSTNGTIVKEGVKPNYHYTYVLWYDGRADIYLDGEHVVTIDQAYKDECTYFKGFRMSMTYTNKDDGDTGESTATISNLRKTVYKDGYTGPMQYLYDNPNVDLHIVEDTVLGGAYQ